MSDTQRRLPRSGPTPVGQRLRASTIPSHRFNGPSAAEWDDESEEDQ